MWLGPRASHCCFFPANIRLMWSWLTMPCSPCPSYCHFLFFWPHLHVHEGASGSQAQSFLSSPLCHRQRQLSCTWECHPSSPGWKFFTLFKFQHFHFVSAPYLDGLGLCLICHLKMCFLIYLAFFISFFFHLTFSLPSLKPPELGLLPFVSKCPSSGLLLLSSLDSGMSAQAFQPASSPTGHLCFSPTIIQPILRLQYIQSYVSSTPASGAGPVGGYNFAG